MKENTTIVPDPKQQARIRRRLQRTNLNEVYGAIPTPPGFGATPYKGLTLALKHLQKEKMLDVEADSDETIRQSDN